MAPERGLGGAQPAGHRAGGTHGDAHVRDAVAFPPEPHGRVEDGQGHPLGPHHPAKGRGLARSGQGQVETHQQFVVPQGRTARPQEQRLQGDPAPSSGGGHFGLGIQGHQRDGAVGRGQGVGHVAAQGGQVAYLRPRDERTGLGQGLGVGAHQRRSRDPGHGHGRAHEKPVAPHLQGLQFVHVRHVHQGVGPGVPSGFDVQEQVRAPGDERGGLRRFVDGPKGLRHGAGTQIEVPQTTHQPFSFSSTPAMSRPSRSTVASSRGITAMMRPS